MTDIRLATVNSYQQNLRAEADANRLAQRAAAARKRSSAGGATPGFAARIGAALAAAGRATHAGTLLDRIRYAG